MSNDPSRDDFSDLMQDLDAVEASIAALPVTPRLLVYRQLAEIAILKLRHDLESYKIARFG